ncbi:MAG: hypothetical protein MJ133_01140 [Lachnospiraceae bacterium]|nr:hypothetical protein [Lachnospiraceae bacterium]
MKKFIKKIFIFISIFIGFFIQLFLFDWLVIGDQYQGVYNASINDKIERLQSIEGPKIILAGDSNLVYGINSELIEQAFEKPVVNLGLNALLGNAFLENMIKFGVSEGDIVILSHWNFNDSDEIMDPHVALTTVEHNWEYWKLFRLKDYPGLIRDYPHYLIYSMFHWVTGESENQIKDGTSNSRAAFNKYGDICKRFDTSFSFSEGSGWVPETSEECMKRINELNEYVKSKGATLLITAYPIGMGEFTPDASLFEEFEKELTAKVNCEVISHFTDYFFDYSLFYDAAVHLNAEGADIRTQRLIDDLKRWMNK